MTEARRDLERWLGLAGPRVRTLLVDPVRGREVARQLGVGKSSTLFAMAIDTGGIVVDGWVRVLGGGAAGVEGDLASWNGLGTSPLSPMARGLFIVGYDVLGGVFALNAGAIDSQESGVHYFAPDSLRWEALGCEVTAWLEWLLTQADHVDAYYQSLRWRSWRADVTRLAFDEALVSLPPLWAAEGKDVDATRRVRERARGVVEIAFDVARQLDGAHVAGPARPPCSGCRSTAR